MVVGKHFAFFSYCGLVRNPHLTAKMLDFCSAVGFLLPWTRGLFPHIQLTTPGVLANGCKTLDGLLGALTCGHGSKTMVPFWDRCTTHFSLFWWGLGCSLGVRGFDPWPCLNSRLTWIVLANGCKTLDGLLGSWRFNMWPMVPFWDRCTTHFSLFWWGLGCSLGVRGFDPWPCLNSRLTWIVLANGCKTLDGLLGSWRFNMWPWFENNGTLLG